MSEEHLWKKIFYKILDIWDENDFAYYDRIGMIKALQIATNEQFDREVKNQ